MRSGKYLFVAACVLLGSSCACDSVQPPLQTTDMPDSSQEPQPTLTLPPTHDELDPTEQSVEVPDCPDVDCLDVNRGTGEFAWSTRDGCPPPPEVESGVIELVDAYTSVDLIRSGSLYIYNVGEVPAGVDLVGASRAAEIFMYDMLRELGTFDITDLPDNFMDFPASVSVYWKYGIAVDGSPLIFAVPLSNSPDNLRNAITSGQPSLLVDQDIPELNGSYLYTDHAGFNRVLLDIETGKVALSLAAVNTDMMEDQVTAFCGGSVIPQQEILIMGLINEMSNGFLLQLRYIRPDVYEDFVSTWLGRYGVPRNLENQELERESLSTIMSIEYLKRIVRRELSSIDRHLACSSLSWSEVMDLKEYRRRLRRVAGRMERS